MPHIQYKHISKSERIIIQNRLENGESLRSIASSIHRNVSSISREVRRNGNNNRNTTTRVNRCSLQDIDSRHFRNQAIVCSIRDSKERYKLRCRLFNSRKAQYLATKAERRANGRQTSAVRVIPKLLREEYSKTLTYIQDKLALRWSPEQITLSMKLLEVP